MASIPPSIDLPLLLQQLLAPRTPSVVPTEHHQVWWRDVGKDMRLLESLPSRLVRMPPLYPIRSDSYHAIDSQPFSYQGRLGLSPVGSKGMSRPLGVDGTQGDLISLARDLLARGSLEALMVHQEDMRRQLLGGSPVRNVVSSSGHEEEMQRLLLGHSTAGFASRDQRDQLQGIGPDLTPTHATVDEPAQFGTRTLDTSEHATMPSKQGRAKVDQSKETLGMKTSTIHRIMKAEHGRKLRRSEADRPKRPMSAYNVFFKEERSRLLETMESPIQVESRKRMRKDRPEPHNKISFQDLGRHISDRWRKLPPDELAEYQRKAGLDKNRYFEEKAALSHKV